MTIGLYSIIAAKQMKVLTYAFSTYELALAQACENEKGVTVPIERLPESRQENGLRQTVWKYPRLFELVIVQEVEVGTAVLPVVLGMGL